MDHAFLNFSYAKSQNALQIYDVPRLLLLFCPFWIFQNVCSGLLKSDGMGEKSQDPAWGKKVLSWKLGTLCLVNFSVVEQIKDKRGNDFLLKLGIFA
jgi:hypothetical protein